MIKKKKKIKQSYIIKIKVFLEKKLSLGMTKIKVFKKKLNKGLTKINA